MKKGDSFLFVLPNGAIGGAEGILMGLAKHLLSLGFNVDVLLINNKGHENWLKQIPLDNVKYFDKKYFFKNLYLTLQFLASRKFHYTISSNIHVNSVLGILRWLGLLKTKYLVLRESTSVFTRFSGIRLLVYKAEYLMGYSFSDLVICQTKIMQQQLEKGYSLSKKLNIQVIPNPIDLDKVYLDAEYQSVGKYTEYVLAIGRLIEEKGFDILIRAFAKMEHRPSNLLIIGSGVEYNNLRNLIQELDLVENVFLIGFVINPMPYIKAAKVCVVSSRIEGFPNVLLQMMALNSRVVSTICAGEIELIPNIQTCVPNDEDALKKSIEEVLKLSDKELEFNRMSFSQFLQRRDIGLFLGQVKRAILKKK